MDGHSVDQPRRSARTAAKMPVTATPQPSSSAQGKRKTWDADKTPDERLQYLLTNSKSKLTKADLSEIISYNNFLELSEQSQIRLCALLPPTSFMTYTPAVCTSHPDFVPQQSSDSMDIDQSPATLDPTMFSSSFFLSAAHTWQDHLFSSWLGEKATEDLAKLMQGAKEGTLHAEWKDEVWERDHQPDLLLNRKQPSSLDLTTLAKHGLLKEGDVLSYKRTFSTLGVTIEKDLLVDSVNASYTLNFLIAPGSQRALHPSLLVSGGALGEDSGKMLAMQDIADATALERGVLDVDKRVGPMQKFDEDSAGVPNPKTPSGAPSDALRTAIAVRAWKAFTVWRWREEMQNQVELQMIQERGGRERVATLFYLRGCCTS